MKPTRQTCALARHGCAAQALVTRLLLVCGAVSVFADQFYSTRSTSNAPLGRTSLFIWDHATGVHTQINPNPGGGGEIIRDTDGNEVMVAFESTFVGGVSGRAPEVTVYNAGVRALTERATFLAYEAGFRGGVRVAAGAYAGRPGWLGAFQIATTPGAGRPVDLRLWELSGAPVAQVPISSAKQGVLPTLGDANRDGELDLAITPDDGRPELIRIFDVDTGAVIGEVPGGGAAFPVGVRIAFGVLTGGPGASEIVVGNGPGGHPRVRVVFWPPAGPVQRLEILPLETP